MRGRQPLPPATSAGWLPMFIGPWQHVAPSGTTYPSPQFTDNLGGSIALGAHPNYAAIARWGFPTFFCGRVGCRSYNHS